MTGLQSIRDVLYREIKIGSTVAFIHPEFHLLLIGTVISFGTHPGKIDVLYEGESLIQPDTGYISAPWRETIYLGPENAILVSEEEMMLYRLRKEYP